MATSVLTAVDLQQCVAKLHSQTLSPGVEQARQSREPLREQEPLPNPIDRRQDEEFDGLLHQVATKYADQPMRRRRVEGALFRTPSQ